MNATEYTPTPQEAREMYQDILDAIRRLGEIADKHNRNKVTVIFLSLIDCADMLKRVMMK